MLPVCGVSPSSSSPQIPHVQSRPNHRGLRGTQEDRRHEGALEGRRADRRHRPGACEGLPDRHRGRGPQQRRHRQHGTDLQGSDRSRRGAGHDQGHTCAYGWSSRNYRDGVQRHPCGHGPRAEGPWQAGHEAERCEGGSRRVRQGHPRRSSLLVDLTSAHIVPHIRWTHQVPEAGHIYRPGNRGQR